jgi:hypothetical protein
MGRLIKNHWARLIMLTASAIQIAAALEGFFWPKVFWDFLTKLLDPAVKPIPILQTVNLVFGIVVLAYEWPLKFIAGSKAHESIELRLMFIPLLALASALMYQSTNAALYYLIGECVYFWAYSDGEVSIPRSRIGVVHGTNGCNRLFARNRGRCRNERWKNQEYESLEGFHES